jgi:hypothetical protein
MREVKKSYSGRAYEKMETPTKQLTGAVSGYSRSGVRTNAIDDELVAE